jgi:hypothetical protein
MWTGGKKRLIRLQVHPYKDSPTGLITPVGEYLQVLAPQTFSYSGTTSAVSSTLYNLAGIIVPVWSVSVSLYLWRVRLI